LNEFDLIRTYFDRPSRRADLGIGDDCALLSPSPGMQWAISTDMLVQGRHFFADVNPNALGHKALAVNLSDLAAMGAKPVAFTLALALPELDTTWLQGFSQGLLALADAHSCELVGGDTTAGPLNISITVMGEVPKGQALQRSGAQVGDDIYVSGQLGWARLGLAIRNGVQVSTSQVCELAIQALEWPQPRLTLGQSLRGLASAALDLSDGLSGDLAHLLNRSGVGACLYQEALAKAMGPDAIGLNWSTETLADWVLAGGDDYELCFTAAPTQRNAIHEVSAQCKLSCHRVGIVSQTPGIVCMTEQGLSRPILSTAFDHFNRGA
jgi:thiamine-monophosphate kinase